MSTIIKDFTLGADPEFACELNREIIVAGDVLQDRDTAEFGGDGNGTTFEIRPAPSKNPLQIVNNIRDIFVRHTLDYPEFLKYKWVAGTWHRGYPLGGHVHFGISADTLNPKEGVNILDHYVGLISLLLEKKEDGLLRRKGGNYGCMGDLREQDWGFEYRPMSSWLGSPYVAAAMLCLSKTVMYERLNNPKFPWREYAQPDDYSLMQQDRIRAIFPEIWADITKMFLYQVYKPYIDLVYFLVKNRLTWFPRSSMKESWAIFNMDACLSNKVGMDMIWHRYNNTQQ